MNKHEYHGYDFRRANEFEPNKAELIELAVAFLIGLAILAAVVH